MDIDVMVDRKELLLPFDPLGFDLLDHS